jgi:hypothetical protein
MATAPVKKSTWGNFTPVKEVIPYRLIWRSYGPEKSGKNHFGLTAPGPIAIQSFDIGLEGVVEKFVKAGKDIRAVSYEFERNDCTQAAAQALRDQFEEDYDIALQQGRSVIWDTESELWELFRFAEFGENAQGVSTDAPRNYVRLNSRFRDLVQRAYDSEANLQLIEKVKERWKTNDKGSPVPSGQFEPTGFKESGYLVQANIRHSWDKENGFGLHIQNCRQNMAIAGESYYNVEFAEIAQLVFSESSEEDWQ